METSDSESGNEQLLDVGRGGVVTAKGTADGLVLRLDGRVEKESLSAALAEFIEPRKGFLSGNQVLFEWVGERPEGIVIDALSKMLADRFRISVTAQSLQADAEHIVDLELGNSSETNTAAQVDKILSAKGIEAVTPQVAPSMSRSLFDGMGDMDSEGDVVDRAVDPSAWDDADARVVYTTLRSGQRIETEHSLVLIGDVNPGAELVAGGDVIVLGRLRGIAHAGAYDETGGGRFIFALSLQPTQLRIGTTISRGSGEGSRVPECAKIEGNIIVVEPFNNKRLG